MQNLEVILTHLYQPRCLPFKVFQTFMLLSMTKKNQKAKFFRSLGQLVPSVTKTLARAPPSSTIENPFGHSGINFTGCKLVLHNLGTEKAIFRVRSRYKH